MAVQVGRLQGNNVEGATDGATDFEEIEKTPVGRGGVVVVVDAIATPSATATPRMKSEGKW